MRQAVRGALAVAMMIGTTLHAQTELPPPQEDPGLRAEAALDAGRYLEADTLLRSLAFDAAGKMRDSDAFQRWSQVHSVIAGEPPAPPEGAFPDRGIDPPLAARIAAAVPRDGIAVIVERAAATRIVILNEDHAVPRDRAFGLEVARALRPLGYDILAAETFSNDANDSRLAAKMASFARDGYVRRQTGVYTVDPVFADFARQALMLGYRPVAYDETTSDQKADWATRIARREQAEADYLVARALRAHPGSKVLIYVGFGHVDEQPHVDSKGRQQLWMAARLKQQTGIDPLTIDQTFYNERTTFTAANPAYTIAMAKTQGRSIVLTEGDRPLVLGGHAGLVDLQVIHPRLPPVGGRPGWLAAMNRVPTPVPTWLLPTTGTRLIQAFVAREGEDAIPVDQLLVTAGEPVPQLMLPHAPVRYAYQDPSSAQ